MKHVTLGLATVLSACSAVAPDSPADTNAAPSMALGNFSISLAVRDLVASRTFYEKLGFAMTGGNSGQNWLIMQNGTATIGLFQGMFEKNIMTFNPGWDYEGNNLESFTDIRELQERLRADGITMMTEADEASSGPASFTMMDPDGNMILVDQHR